MVDILNVSNIKWCRSSSTRSSGLKPSTREDWTWPGADEVLAGPTLTVEDDRRNYGEDRFITIGFPRQRDGDPRLDAAPWHASDHQHEEGQ